MYVQGVLFFFGIFISCGVGLGVGGRGGGLEQFGCCGAGWEGKGGLGFFSGKARAVGQMLQTG